MPNIRPRGRPHETRARGLPLANQPAPWADRRKAMIRIENDTVTVTLKSKDILNRFVNYMEEEWDNLVIHQFSTVIKELKNIMGRSLTINCFCPEFLAIEIEICLMFFMSDHGKRMNVTKLARLYKRIGCD
jgi:hypothetical protein